MRYVALLRGINVGGNRNVSMLDLRAAFENLGFDEVSTYIQSGNVIFSAKTEPSAVEIQGALRRHFGFDIDTLILSAARIVAIAQAIPAEWANNNEQKSDVLYLFPDVDAPDCMTHIGYRPAYETIYYVPGALITNVTRKHQSKSSLRTPLYRRLTVRNVTTARHLAALVQQ